MWKWLLLLLFCAYATAEVYALLALGDLLGVGWTLTWMIASALLGVAALRVGGLYALVRIHRKLREQELPTLELLDMAMTVVGALLLITPGFVADALGVLLLLPPVRWFAKGCCRAMFGELVRETEPRMRGAPPVEEAIELTRDEYRSTPTDSRAP